MAVRVLALLLAGAESAANPGGLTAVGDESQGIYGWTGAEPQFVRYLRADCERCLIAVKGVGCRVLAAAHLGLYPTNGSEPDLKDSQP